MALRAVYERFLAAPTLDVLSSDASWNYITTTTSVTGSDQIIKHLNNQAKVVKKKGDKTLSAAIETADALVLDMETTLEFVTGGGAYLPSLDDNFLADRVVTIPTVHIVRFNAQGQIQQVKLYWDQGSLLKQVEVIGSRGRNWPIRDASEQVKLIANVATAQGTVTPPPAAQEKVPAASGRAPYAPSSHRPPVRDPSELFTGGAEPENEPTPRAAARESIISPRAGADKHFRPVRVFGEDDDEPAASPIKPRIGSSKGFQPVRVFDVENNGENPETQQPRAGSTKNFHAVRVFDVENDGTPDEKERAYKTNPTKFNHFELGDAADGAREVQDKPAVRSRPMSQWAFEDFTTPEKPRQKFRPQDARHFGWSDNEEESIETPPARPRVVQPRRDAQTHILNLEDDVTADAPAPSRRTIGSFQNKGMGLYNQLYDEEGKPTPHVTEEESNGNHNKLPLGIVPNNSHRKKDFDAHWEAHDPTEEDRRLESAENIRPVSSDRVKAVKAMASSWDIDDETAAAATTTTLPKRASRAVFQPSWSLGDD